MAATLKLWVPIPRDLLRISGESWRCRKSSFFPLVLSSQTMHQEKLSDFFFESLTRMTSKGEIAQWAGHQVTWKSDSLKYCRFSSLMDAWRAWEQWMCLMDEWREQWMCLINGWREQWVCLSRRFRQMQHRFGKRVRAKTKIAIFFFATGPDAPMKRILDFAIETPSFGGISKAFV